MGALATAPIATSARAQAPQPQGVLGTVHAAADTYVHAGDPNTNEGGSGWLRVWAPGNSRTLVRFPIDDVRTMLGDRGVFYRAYLRLDLVVNDQGCGAGCGGSGQPDGQWVNAYRMTQPWAEGSGWVSERAIQQSIVRGTGAGTTWLCANDADIADHRTDCSGGTAWDMTIKPTTTANPWVAAPTNRQFIRNDRLGFVYWDVTADVTAMLAGAPSHGWLLRAEDENHGGRLLFSSRTGTGNPPVLVVDYLPYLNSPPNLALGTAVTLPEGSRLLRTASVGDPDSTAWTGRIAWGDGTTEPLMVAPDGTFRLDHVYADDGVYTLSVLATDEYGDSDTDSITVTVTNVAPVVYAGPDAQIFEGALFSQSVTFTDPGSDVWSATVDYGDGTTETLAPGTRGFELSHVYANAGSYTVVVGVCDDDGGCGEDRLLVIAADLEPVAAFTWSPEPQDEGSPVLFVDRSVSQPWDPLTYAWSFAALGTSTEASPSFVFARNGQYSVCLTVTDDEGTSDTACNVVTIRDLGPTAAFSWSPAPQDEGSPVQFTDQSSPAVDPIVSWAWTFGAGLGSASDASPSFTFTQDDAHQVCLTVTDSDGSTSSVCHQIVVVNVAPKADAGGPYVVDEGSSVTLTGTASDPGLDIVAYAWDLDGDGQLDDATTPSTTFTSTRSGAYTVTFRVTDDDGASGTDTAEVTVRNVAPTADAGGPYTGAEGSTITLSAAGSSDPGHDIVSYAWDLDGDGQFDDATGESVTITRDDDAHLVVAVLVTDADGATGTDTAEVTFTNTPPVVSAGPAATIAEGSAYAGSGAITDAGADTFTATVDYGDGTGAHPLALAAGGTFTLAHVYADDGHYTITVAVTDDDGGSASTSVAVDVQNVAPVVAAGADANVDEGSVYAGLASFADPGVLDTFTALVDYGDGTGFHPAAIGPLYTVALSHVYADDGTYAVEVLVIDDDGGVGSDLLLVHVNNVVPTVDAGAVATLDEGSTFTSHGTYADPGADTFTATVDYGDGSALATLAVSGGTVPLSHRYLDDGVYTVTVRVTDDDGGSSLDTTTVTVRNVSPVVSAGADVSVNADEVVSRTGSFTDPGADTWTATIDYGNGSGAEALQVGANKSFSLAHIYVLPGTYTVTITVRDDDGGVGVGTFRVTVTRPASCTNGIRDGEELLVDCGGSCAPCPSFAASYTTTAEFNTGTLTGVNATATANQLQLDSYSTVEPYIWIANYAVDTVTKIDTRTGRQVAKYRSFLSANWDGTRPNLAPTNSNSPSRTAVDSHGDAFVANRAFGYYPSVTKFAGSETRCVDRNHNGVIDTSRDLNNDGLISTVTGSAEFLGQNDECIMWTANYAAVNDYGRSLSIDSDDNVWAGGFNTAKLYKLNGTSGALMRTLDPNTELGTTAYLYGVAIGPGDLLFTSDITNRRIRRVDTTVAIDSCVPNGDFQSGATSWSATGTAFAGWPHSSCSSAGTCYDGRGVSTLNAGNTATGTLRSAPFTITQRYLCWWAGGYGSSYTAIDVDADGTDDVTLTQRGTDGSTNGNSWAKQCVDLNAYIGRTARVTLVDNDAGSTYAWAAWDSFECRSSQTWVRELLSPIITYGIAADRFGQAWLANWNGGGGGVVRANFETNTATWLGTNVAGCTGQTRGVAVDANDDIWFSCWSNNRLVHITNTGALVNSYAVGAGPIGVAIDGDRNIWTANQTANNATRVNPTTGAVASFSTTGEPYSYSDMTGFQRRNFTERTGEWSTTYDSRRSDTPWGTITWNTEAQGAVPAGTSIVVSVRVANSTTDLASATWITVDNGVAFRATGRYLQVRAAFTLSTGTVSPVLSDLSIRSTDPLVLACPTVTPSCTGTGCTTPTAVLTGPYTGREGRDVFLNGACSFDPQNDIVAYAWDLNGDGVYGDATGSTTYFTSQTDGPHTVSLRVTDARGGTSVASTTVTLSNGAPVAYAGGPYFVDEGSNIELSAVGTYDLGNDLARYEWDLDGDGQWDDALGQVVQYSGRDDAQLVIGLRAVDDDGAASLATAELTVRNVPPTLTLATNTAATTEHALFTLEGRITDPSPVDVLTVSADLGDGFGLRTVPVAPDGTFLLAGSYEVLGTYAVQVFGADDDGGRAYASATVTVTCNAGTDDCDGVQANGCEIDLVTDTAHCGTCGTTCSVANGTAACVSGACQVGGCAAGYSDCDATYANGCETALDTTSNCGGCGVACVAANGVPACTAGTCTFSCLGGYADCDGLGANGCEANLASTTSCGSCGNACNDVDGVASCLGGQCSMACAAGHADCDGLGANGCEANLGSILSCGACGNACPTVANAGSTCTHGACGYTCMTGFADCDGSSTNGCEADLGSTSSCGACGNVCPTLANAAATCTTGNCGYTCATGWDDCDGNAANGCETSVTSDPASCGGCGITCPTPPNASPTCENAACGLACAPGFANCDGDAANGCETAGHCPCVAPQLDCDGNDSNGCEANLLTDAENCGQCNDACGYPNAYGVCSNGVCAFGSCQAGFGDCDGDSTNGCERPTTSDPRNCGACGHECPSGQFCSEGQCQSPFVEVCDGVDNDGDGQVDEDLTQPCESACGAGVVSCVNGRWTACSAPQPRPETCNGRDDDCNGAIDDGIYPSCAPGWRTGNGVPPLAVIENITENQVIGTRVDVVGSTSLDVDAWILEWAYDGSSRYTKIAGGTTSVTHGVLGTLDPTLIDNGMIHLRLRVVDVDGYAAAAERAVIIEGENKVGDVTFSSLDLKVDVGGLPIEVVRTYDSKHKAEPTDFGYGADLQIGPKGAVGRNRSLGDGWDVFCPDPYAAALGQPGWVDELAPHIISVQAGGASYKFQLLFTNVAYHSHGVCYGQMVFRQLEGRPATLAIVGDATGYWINDGQLSIWEDIDYGTGFPYDLHSVMLTDRASGTAYRITRGVGIDQITDASGNTVTITASGVTSSAGVSVGFGRDAQGRLTRVTDPSGQSVSYAYDTTGNLTRVTDRTGAATSYEYTPDHSLSRVIDPEGTQAMRVEYDGMGRVKKALGPDQQVMWTPQLRALSADLQKAGYSLQMFWDPRGRITQTASSNGGGTTMERDANGNVTREVDALGHVTLKTWDSHQNLTSVTLPGGGTTHMVYAYDAAGVVTQVTQTDPVGRVLTAQFDSAGRPTRVVQPTGTVVEAAYDSAGRRTRATLSDGSRTDAIAFTYDAQGRMASKTDPLGRVTTFGYDPSGRTTQVGHSRTLPDGTVVLEQESMAYDAEGRLTQHTDALGHVTMTTYDGNGKVSAVRDALGVWTTFERDNFGNVTRTHRPASAGYPRGMDSWEVYDPANQHVMNMDADGVMTQFAYDTSGRLTRTTYPDGSFEAATYDALGRKTQETDRTGVTWTTTYDVDGNVTSVVGSNGRTRTATFDQAKRPLTIGSELGTTNLTYDPRGFVTRSVAPSGAVLQTTLDSFGRVLAQVDELGGTVTQAYDAVGHVTRRTDQNGAVSQFAYDEQNHLTAMTDGNGHTTRWEYDAGGRLTRHVLPSGAAERFAYDESGRLASRTTFDGRTTTFGYDGMNRLVSAALPDGTFVQHGYTTAGRRAFSSDAHGTTAWSYDELGRLMTVTSTGGAVRYTYDGSGRIATVASNAGTTRYEYDQGGNLMRVTDPRGGLTSYVYDVAGRPMTVTLPNGATTSYQYDASGQRSRIEHRGPDTSLLLALVQEFDAAGHPTLITESGVLGQRTRAFAFDPRGQLVSETTTNAAGTSQVSYGYDAAGNRTSLTDASGTTSFVYDADDHLLVAGATTFEYDANGNLTHRDGPSGSLTYGYDALDRLTRIESPTAPNVTYAYDVDGLRTSRTVGGVETRFVWDRLRKDAQLLEEQSAAGTTLASYTYGLERLSRTEGGATTYFHGDHLGSVRIESDAAGQAQAGYAYDAFGQVAMAGVSASPFGFAGEQRDAESGLTYLRARYYDPSIGRFLTRDSWADGPNKRPDLHPYAYADGNPITYVDPSGHMSSLVEAMATISIQAIELTISMAARYGVYKLSTELKNAGLDAATSPSGFVLWDPSLGVILDQVWADSRRVTGAQRNDIAQAIGGVYAGAMLMGNVAAGGLGTAGGYAMCLRFNGQFANGPCPGAPCVLSATPNQRSDMEHFFLSGIIGADLGMAATIYVAIPPFARFTGIGALSSFTATNLLVRLPWAVTGLGLVAYEGWEILLNPSDWKHQVEQMGVDGSGVLFGFVHGFGFMP